MRFQWRKVFPSNYNFLQPFYWFGDIDARPASLFRIAFGALMLKEALYHIPMAEIFYSDSGILSRSVLEATFWGGHFSLMNVLSQNWMAVAFFSAWALIALGLLVGYRTRLMTVLNFIFLLSVVNRNPVIASGADMAMIAFAFWSLFIPLGQCYSIDARRTPKSKTIYAFPVRMLQIQLAIIYIFTMIIKLQGHSWAAGDALYLALHVKMYTFPLGDWLLANAPVGLLQALTGFTLLVEGAFTLLVFAPFLQPYLRGLGLILGAVLHIGIGLMMAIPNFPLVMLSVYLVFFDSRWVDWLEKRFVRTKSAKVDDKPAAEGRSGCGALLGDMGRAVLSGSYRAILAAFLLFCMACAVWNNIVNNDTLASSLNVEAMPQGIEVFMTRAGLTQTWNLFAPEPLQNEGWFIFAGQYAGGDLVDPRTDAPPGDVRPRWWIGPWSRWTKFEENMMRVPSYSPILPAWGTYICHEYPGLQSLDIILRAQHIAQPGEAEQPYQDKVMWQGKC